MTNLERVWPFNQNSYSFHRGLLPVIHHVPTFIKLTQYTHAPCQGREYMYEVVCLNVQ